MTFVGTVSAIFTARKAAKAESAPSGDPEASKTEQTLPSEHDQAEYKG
jgi:hypothetical protein